MSKQVLLRSFKQWKPPHCLVPFLLAIVFVTPLKKLRIAAHPNPLENLRVCHPIKENLTHVMMHSPMSPIQSFYIPLHSANMHLHMQSSVKPHAIFMHACLSHPYLSVHDRLQFCTSPNKCHMQSICVLFLYLPL